MMVESKIVSLTRELIAFPSLSGKERDVQKFLFQRLQEKGAKPFFQGENLILRLEGKDKTRCFVFNSHVDVVDSGEISRWKHDPWKGEIENGFIYGRGSCDMKAGVASSVSVAEILLAQKNDLPIDVWFVFVTREETDGFGTKSFAEWFKNQECWSRYRQIAVIFTEPTNLISVGYGCRGNFFLKANVEGQAGHASMPDQVHINAPKVMIDFISCLNKKNKKWSQKLEANDFASPTITTTGLCSESTSPNRIPELATAVFDLRTTPGFHSEAHGEVVKLARRFGVRISLICPESPPCLTRPDSKIITSLQKIVSGLRIETLPYATDMSFFSGGKIEGVIFGPGDPNQAHTIDESVSVEQVLRSPQFYKDLYFAWA